MNPKTLAADPIPGDPEQVQRISAQFATVEARAEEILSRLRSVETGIGPQMWRGDAANSFTALLAATGPDLTTLATSYGIASQALATYATELATAQDTARAAQAEAATATEARDRATADRDTARSEADRHAAAAADAQARMDLVAAQAAEQRHADALGRENAAGAAMDQAQQSLQAAERKGDDAMSQRDAAAARCVRELDDASRTAIENRNLTHAPAAPNGPPPAAPAGAFSLSDIGHAILDVAGLVPLFGEAADGINAAWYTAEGDYANAALSAAATIPGFGAAATAARLAAKGSDIARLVDNAPGPHTPLAPQGGLRRHEDAGGHTLDPNKAHVGATDQQLLSRLANEPHLKAVSSYNDRATAERAISESIAGNQGKIQQWLQSGKSKLELPWQHGASVGRHAPQGSGAAGIADVRGSFTVLRRDPSMPEGYRIQTSFPTP